MRLLPFAIALTLAASAGDSRAGAPTMMIVRNPTAGPSRVQVSLGPAFPCDASEDRMMFDEVVPAGATRTFAVGDAILACVRSTSAGSTLNWGPSMWVGGGRRCGRGHGSGCWRDPSVPMVYDVPG